MLVFHIFSQLIGRLGDAEMGATTLAIRLNMIAFLPMMGLGQAVCVLVGQRLGANQPDLAEATTYTGLKWSFGYMCMIATAYLAMPELLVSIFEGDSNPEKFAKMAAIVPSLLTCVAIYSLADAVNLTFAFAFAGPANTFVTCSFARLAHGGSSTAVVVMIGASVY